MTVPEVSPSAFLQLEVGSLDHLEVKNLRAPRFHGCTGKKSFGSKSDGAGTPLREILFSASFTVPYKL